MVSKLLWILGFCLACFCGGVVGEEKIGVSDEEELVDCESDAECGWLWGYWKDVEGDEEIAEEQGVSETKPKEDKCKSKDSWSVECGFVDPKGDYAFMVIQRDKLSETALMNTRVIAFLVLIWIFSALFL